MSRDLIERLRKFIATKGLMLPATEFEMLALVANELDYIAALEAEASEGERRVLERAADAAEREIENAWSQGVGRANGDIASLNQALATANLCLSIPSAIRALIPKAPAREGWQPIETAPKDGSEIILFFPSYKEERVAAYRWRDVGGPHPEWEGIDGWSFDEGPDAEDAPTHWRPLPPPPSQDREPESQRGAK